MMRKVHSVPPQPRLQLQCDLWFYVKCSLWPGAAGDKYRAKLSHVAASEPVNSTGEWGEEIHATQDNAIEKNKTKQSFILQLDFIQFEMPLIRSMDADMTSQCDEMTAVKLFWEKKITKRRRIKHCLMWSSKNKLVPTPLIYSLLSVIYFFTLILKKMFKGKHLICFCLLSLADLP